LSPPPAGPPAEPGRPPEPEAERLGAIGVLEREGRLLVVQRAEGLSHAGRWCFPGGHLEPGETSAQAIVRELREELGIEVEAGPHLGDVHVPSPRYRLFVHRVRWVSGELAPDGREIAGLRWLTRDEVAELAEAMPSNAQVVALLNPRSAPR
jgi:8-oxo-dGTP diphosphatase